MNRKRRIQLAVALISLWAAAQFLLMTAGMPAVAHHAAATAHDTEEWSSRQRPQTFNAQRSASRLRPAHQRR